MVKVTTINFAIIESTVIRAELKFHDGILTKLKIMCCDFGIAVEDGLLELLIGCIETTENVKPCLTDMLFDRLLDDLACALGAASIAIMDVEEEEM